MIDQEQEAMKYGAVILTGERSHYHARDLPEGTLRAILREADIDTDKFLRM